MFCSKQNQRWKGTKVRCTVELMKYIKGEMELQQSLALLVVLVDMLMSKIKDKESLWNIMFTYDIMICS